MFEALRRSLRKGELKKHASTIETGILPLSKVQRVVVFLPAAEAYEKTLAAIRGAFPGRELSIFALQQDKNAADDAKAASGLQAAAESGGKVHSDPADGAILLRPKDLNWTGRVRSSKKTPKTDRGEDLFISLFEEDPYAVEYAARCSRARFKAGRRQLSPEVYDFVIMTPDGEVRSPAEAFAEMLRMMNKIK